MRGNEISMIQRVVSELNKPWKVEMEFDEIQQVLSQETFTVCENETLDCRPSNNTLITTQHQW
jgi:hypothetical protein